MSQQIFLKPLEVLHCIKHHVSSFNAHSNALYRRETNIPSINKASMYGEFERSLLYIYIYIYVYLINSYQSVGQLLLQRVYDIMVLVK